MKLNYFKEIKFLPAIKALLKELNVPVNYISDEPTTAQEILEYTYKENETFRLIEDVYFVGMVDDAAFEGNQSFDHTKIKSDYDGILFFGVELAKREKDLLPTRSQLAGIARAFNREFHFTPVVVVFKYANDKEEFISFANTERIKYKQEWREGEKAGKVSLLRDISIEKPHRGHEDIINELRITTFGKKAIRSFDALYQYWQEVFSVNILNKKFYQELSNWYFWAIKNVTFPSEPNLDDVIKKYGQADHDKLTELINEHNATNVIRLLTRLLFTWFIKEKKLIPETLFDLDALQTDILKDINPYQQDGMFKNANTDSVYYKAILQNLFFASLNCPIEADSIDKRKRGFRGDGYGTHRGIDYLMRYKKQFRNPDAFLNLMNETVPFLNGGLFECLDDKYQNTYIDGFSDQMTKGEQLIVPDFLFFGLNTEVDLSQDYGSKNKKHKKAAVKGLINILKSYKFTITENTPIEEDVALDPELLGKVFENLLASYNPETKSTARKQTGSFYTPREIVNYMVDESIIAYLKNALDDWGMDKKQVDDKLHTLTSFDPINPFEANEELSISIIKALDKCKILDPACGSGAFPMGILQKLVHILQKLDSGNEVWKKVQLEKAIQESKDAYVIEDKQERENKLIEINNAFDSNINDPDYARKLYLIENCIYGVDIQPIATQISKLRFFISLVVDQKNNNDIENNFGIRPLPNLETKFVTANTLIGIEKPSGQTTLSDTDTVKSLEKELKSIRHKLFGARTKDTKLKYRKKDEELRNAISIELKKSGWHNETADKLSSWDPYDQNASASFFDSEWMFDIKKGFDVVIGNPPYLQLQSILEESKILSSIGYDTYTKSGDIYCLFYERGFSLLSTNGVLTYITSNKWMRAGYGKKMREYFIKNVHIAQLIDFGDSPIFENATTYTNIIIGTPLKDSKSTCTKVWDMSYETHNQFDLSEQLVLLDHFSQEFSVDSFLIFDSADLLIKNKIESIGKPISKWTVTINRGLITGFNEAYIISTKQKEDLVKKNPNSIDLIKPILRGKDIKKYKADFNDYWMIIAKYGSHRIIQDEYSAIFEHLSQYKTQLKLRGQCTNRGGKGQHHWLELDNNPTDEYLKRFEQPKIVWAEIVYDSAFYYDETNTYQEATGFLMIGDNLKYLVAILNSKAATYFFKKYYAGGDLRGNTFRYKKAFLQLLPIPVLSKEKQYPFETLASIIQWISSNKKQEHDLRSNILTNVLDAIVLNAYFPFHLDELNLQILNNVQNDINEVFNGKEFNSLENEQKEQGSFMLHKLWTDPDNKARNRIKLFAVRSPDILKPILES